MAKIERIEPERPVEYVLTLTEEEARYVMDALMHVCPKPRNRFGRDAADPVFDALDELLPTQVSGLTAQRPT